MSLQQKALNIYAPSRCVSCGTEGKSLCAGCSADIPKNYLSRCFMCAKWSKDYATCAKCRRKTPLQNVWVAAEYDGTIKELIHGYKYERDRSAAPVLAEIIAGSLPFLPEVSVVTHIPTATSRVRARGYDHSKLLAIELSKKLGIRHSTLLGRVGQAQQMGAKRKDRISQASRAYVGTRKVTGSVLLVDDVLTTGATLNAAAKELRKAGATHTYAAVVAHHSS